MKVLSKISQETTQDFRAYDGSIPKEVEKKKIPEKVVEKKKKPVALNFDENREFGGLEAEIERLQKNKASIETQFLNVEIPTDEIAAKSQELQAIIKKLEQKEERWLELSMKLEG